MHVRVTSRVADLARQREVVNAYNRFVEKVMSYQLDKRAFEPTLLDVSKQSMHISLSLSLARPLSPA